MTAKLVSIICILIIGLTTLGSANIVTPLDETNVIGPESYTTFQLDPGRASWSQMIAIDVEVLNGGAINILVLNETYYAEYERGMNVEEYAIDYVKSVKGKVYILGVQPDNYSIVVENRHSKDEVDVRVRLDTYASGVHETPGFSIILAIGLLFVARYTRKS